MHRPIPLPLGKVDSTIHASARTLANPFTVIALSDIERFGSAQEQVEFFTLVRDWSTTNLAYIEQLATGAEASAGG